MDKGDYDGALTLEADCVRVVRLTLGEPWKSDHPYTEKTRS